MAIESQAEAPAGASPAVVEPSGAGGTGPRGADEGLPPGARRRLGFAAAGVLLGAADTYVVVIVLPAIMGTVGLDLGHLSQATPIISGFLLGYVVVLPLLGRLSDLYGRTPVLLLSLVVFATGSLITASAGSLVAVVAGRTLQGLGGGGLVPVTLALAADLWPAPRRGPALGLVAAVQELGSVVGPLYGAAVGATAGWRAIFYVNLPLAGAVAAGVRGAAAGRRERRDTVGWVLALLAACALILAVAAPPALTDSITAGVLYVPLLGGVAASSPIAVAAAALVVGLLLRELTVPAGVRPLLPVRRLPKVLADIDWLGALLLSITLGVLVAVFASADPARQTLSDAAPVLLPLGVLSAALFVARQLRTARPLVDLRALSSRSAIGSLLANLALGAALMAVLVDVPVLARVTVDADSQVSAALVLARLLVAVPLGVVVGGWCVRALGHRLVAGAGMLLAAAMLLSMTGWTAASLSAPLLGLAWLHPSDPVLLAAGFGFGLAVVPTTAAMLGAVPTSMHGVAASLTVAARLVGMLTGLSLLTAIGLRHFYAVQAALPLPGRICPSSPLACPAYDRLVTGAVLDELHFIFAGAAVCAALAAVLAVLLLGGRRRGSASAGRAG